MLVHYLTLVVFDEKPLDTQAATDDLLAPFRAEQSWLEGEPVFDWYEIGGRWDWVIAGNEGSGKDVCRALAAEDCLPCFVFFETAAPTAWASPVEEGEWMQRAVLDKLRAHHRDKWIVVADLHG